MYWYLKVLKQYADFKGRARRKEYWMFQLMNFMITMLIVLAIVMSSISYEDSIIKALLIFILILYAIATIIPSIAVSVRRLHDVGKSGWMYCVSFIPFIGGIWLLVLMITDGDIYENEYGPNPKEESINQAID